MIFVRPNILFWLIPWIVLVALAIRNSGRGRRRLSYFIDAPNWARLAQEDAPIRQTTSILLQLLGLAFFILACAGPQMGSERIKVERQAIDIVFAVDCSRSMLAEDPAPNRRQVAARELTTMMEKFRGNRMGLVGFAGAAYIFCPLTLDGSATELFLEQLDENAVPIAGTAIGKALEVSRSIFPKDSNSSKILILLTDGEDHKSNPIEAAQAAAKAGITIYTVGIGSPEGAKIPDSMNGQFVLNSKGDPVISKMDESTLKEIALIGGGKYVRIGSSSDNLDDIVQSVLSKEKKKLNSQMMIRRKDRAAYFVALGLLLIALGNWAIPRIMLSSDKGGPKK